MNAHRVLDALGDQTRREIVERLHDGPLPVGELAATLRVGRPAVSKHLRVLAEAGLVTHRSVGTRNLYALAPTGLESLRQWIDQLWDHALTAFAAHVAAATLKEHPDDDHQTGDPATRRADDR